MPALVIEYKNKEKDKFDWDKDDLYQVASYFGEIDCIEIVEKSAFLLFKSFFEAFSCKEYLLITNNFKSLENDNSNINIRWYNTEDEKTISKNLQDKIRKASPSDVISNLNHSSNYTYPNNLNYNVFENFCTNINTLNSYYAAWTLTPNARNEFNSILCNQNMFNNQQNYGNNYNNYPISSNNNNFTNMSGFYNNYNKNFNRNGSFIDNNNFNAKVMKLYEIRRILKTRNLKKRSLMVNTLVVLKYR